MGRGLGDSGEAVSNSVSFPGTSCGADFFSNAGDKADSPQDAGGGDADSFSGGGERRRSERVKREKPDYYDALDFENKRKTTPTRPRRERAATGSSPSGGGGEPGERSAHAKSPRVREDRPEKHHKSGRGRGGGGAGSATGRATLTWKKGKAGHDDDDDERDRRRRKRPRNREDDESVHMMDDLSSEKGLQCRVTLAEINRKLGVVMVQPGQP